MARTALRIPRTLLTLNRLPAGSCAAPPASARRRAIGWLAASGATLLLACCGRDLAPDVGYTLLDGSKGSTGSLRGQVLLVNFWATSCTACVREMPKIAATFDKYHTRGFETLAVAMSYDPPAAVAQFAETSQLPFGVVIDNTGAVARAFGEVGATPTSVLIDRHGAIVRRFVGAPDFHELHLLVEKLLAQA